MKARNLWLAVTLCCAIGASFGLAGCGDDEGNNDPGFCESACTKNLECSLEEPMADCIEGCVNGTQAARDCVANNCSTDSECGDWIDCLLDCGV
jgi:hypothetical protein